MRFILLLFIFSIPCVNSTAQMTGADSTNLESWLKTMLLSLDKAEKGTFKYSNIAYNAADLYAMKNNKDSTFYYLNAALSTCPYIDAQCSEVYLPDVLGTCFFEKWHSTNEWKAFEKQVTNGFYSTNKNLKNPQLSYNLLKAKGAEQTIRYHFFIVKSDVKKPNSKASVALKRIDSLNMVFIKNTVDKHGFPSISMVGKEASNAAFLLCQHADGDIAFQKRILADMERLILQNDISPKNYAYLTDRVMVKEKGVQLYGSQFKGNSELYPIIDSLNVDERRRKIGLSSLSEYKKSIIFFNN